MHWLKSRKVFSKLNFIYITTETVQLAYLESNPHFFIVEDLSLQFVLKKLYFRKECFGNSDSITKRLS